MIDTDPWRRYLLDTSQISKEPEQSWRTPTATPWISNEPDWAETLAREYLSHNCDAVLLSKRLLDGEKRICDLIAQSIRLGFQVGLEQPQQLTLPRVAHSDAGTTFFDVSGQQTQTVR